MFPQQVVLEKERRVRPGESFLLAAMYYKFNSFTQRLVGAGSPSAYIPQVMSSPLLFLARDWGLDLQCLSAIRDIFVSCSLHEGIFPLAKRTDNEEKRYFSVGHRGCQEEHVAFGGKGICRVWKLA